MKFILLESRGGNYLVVAENIAWLRTGENGQTNVGMVGGNPLLVVGSIEEVAAKILAATKEDEQAVAQAPATAMPVAAPPSAVAQPVAETSVAAPDAKKPPIEETLASDPAAVAPNPTAPTQERLKERPASAAKAAASAPTPEHGGVSSGRPSTLADRLARTPGPTIKAGKQRFMSISEIG